MNRRRLLILLGTMAILVWPAAYSLTRSTNAAPSGITLVSAGYHIDKIYHSMEGPWSIQKNIQLTPQPLNSQPSTPNRFVWLTGIETQIIDARDQSPVSQEFFCHANLTFAQDGSDQTRQGHIDSRLFTLAPGRTSIQLPPGFGMPVRSDATLDYLTMSLNLNSRKPVDIRMRTTLHTIPADQPGAPIKPLFRRAAYVLQREGEKNSSHRGCNMSSATEPSGLACGEWMKTNLPNGSTVLMPSEGMSNHWTVPPGDHVYTTNITPQLHLPFDTAVHYATIHVHPFARWLELRDRTTGETVLHLNSHDLPDRIGVAQVDELKSIDGIAILRGHQYELAVEYNNTSGASTDAMAILYLYLGDRDDLTARR
jgi:hypothetical protein